MSGADIVDEEHAADLEEARELIGTALGGKWVLDEVLGVGGMATVFGAHHKVVGDRVAVKLLHERHARVGSVRERFKAEASAWGGLRHCGMVRIQDIDDATIDKRPRPYIVMERLEGRTLRAWMAGKPVDAVLDRIDEMLSVLEAAHAAGVVHRDLKPDNVFVLEAGDGAVRGTKLLDFGLARADSVARSRSKVGLGTLAYVSPEQAKSGANATAASDVWSVGVMLHELLSGTNPLGQGSDGELLERLFSPVPFGSLRGRPGVTEAMASLVDACLSKDASQRPQNATALRSMLSSARGAVSAVPQRTPSRLRTDVALPSLPSTSSGAERPSRATAPSSTPRALGGEARSADASRTGWSARGKVGLAAALGLGVALAGAVLVIVVVGGGWLWAERTGAAGALGLGTAPSELVAPPDAGVTPPPVEPAPVVAAPVSCPASMVLIPGGTFLMGSPEGQGEDDEHPQHRVTLSAYCMDRTEVTVAAYEACASTGACPPMPTTVELPGISASERRTYSRGCNGGREGRAQHPLNCVDWPTAEAYCRAQGGRLPSEAEWEYAARGTDGREYPWGNEAPDDTRLRWRGVNQVDGTSPVGGHPSGASPFGLEDMAGNVWEWTSDWYGPYSAADATDPQGAASGDARVSRGGGWFDLQPAWVRAAFRDGIGPAERFDNLGFRCARGA